MYSDIDGWLNDSEANHLFDISHSLPNDAPVVVEIGSWVGKSAVVTSHALSGKPGAKLYCVDPFNADGDQTSIDLFKVHRAKHITTLRELWEANVSKYGVRELVEPLPGYSEERVKDWNKPIDFLYIDANHDYEAVVADYKNWSPFVKPGGWIGFHDVDFLRPTLKLSGPAEAVRDYVEDSDEWINKKLVCSIYSAQKKPA